METTLWIAVGAILAALVARGVKISEFRQAWIDGLRADISEYISKAHEWIDLYLMFNNESSQEKKINLAEKLERIKYEALHVLRRIELRFKPDDSKANVLIEDLKHLLDPAKIRMGSECSEWTSLANEAVRNSRALLKEEWETTKNPFRNRLGSGNAAGELGEATRPTQKVLSHDELIKFVFDNIRNILMCATLFVAAAAVFHFRSEFPLGSYWNGFLALALIIASMGLLSWNLIHGVATIARPYKTNRWRTLFVLIPVAIIYMSAGWAIFTAVPRAEVVNKLHKSPIQGGISK